MSSLERRFATHTSTLPTFQLAFCTDSQVLSVGLSVTADTTSSHFVSKARSLSFFNCTFDKSLESKMASLSPLILKRPQVIQEICLPVSEPLSD